MDDLYQAFRIDQFILCLGEGMISFDSQDVLEKQLWIAKETLLNQTLSRPSTAAIEHLIPLCGETELLYKCLRHGSFNALEIFLSLGTHLEKKKHRIGSSFSILFIIWPRRTEYA